MSAPADDVEMQLPPEGFRRLGWVQRCVRRVWEKIQPQVDEIARNRRPSTDWPIAPVGTKEDPNDEN